MSQISSGTVVVQNGSTKVIKSAGGPSWVTVKKGCLFAVQTDSVVYPITTFVPSGGGINDSLTLSAPYQGASGTVPYVIVQDLTPALNLPLINTGDLMTNAIYNEAIRILDFAGVNSGGGGTGGVGGGGTGGQIQTGDMLIAVYDTNSDNVVDGCDGPLILASPSTNTGLFPGSIAVPPYFDHPDKAWTYGPYDDHFDGTGAIAPKWGPFNASAGQITKTRSMVHMQGFNVGGTGPYLQSGVPGGNFQVQMKIKFFNAIQYAGAYSGQCWTAIYAYVGVTIVGSIRMRFAYTSYPTMQGPPYNELVCYYEYGPNVTNVIPVSLSGTLPEYWGFNISPGGNSSVGLYSWDARTWFAFVSGITNSQAGWNSSSPNVFQLACYPGPSAQSSLVCDWIRMFNI